VSRVRALFLGTPEIAKHCLEAMIKDPHFEVVGVVTQPDRPSGRKLEFQPSPVKALAKPLGIPVLTPDSINTPEAMDAIKTLKAEVAVVVAYGQILKQAFLDLYPAKVVNVHASLLPRWRGAAPIQRAVMNGDTETGVCLQVMVKKLDAGPVLGSRTIAITEETTAADVYRQCQELGALLISVDLMDYLRGNLSATPQDPDKVTLAPKIDKAEAEINWQWPARKIHNLVRGLNMGPVAQTRRDGKILKIHKTKPLNGKAGKPGQIQSAGASLIVNCGEGSLELLEVQPESRSRMPVTEYLRGYPVKAGDQFG
jgi:methionyl-tRNA formyltransferase